jgi:arsenite-transporting ATPase
MLLIDREIVFFGGKGGVGKTTCSAAFALGASRLRKRVLLVSTDPAHSTADIFERPLAGQPREIAPNLSAMEIDADREASRYVDQVKREIERIFSPNIIREAHRQIDMAAQSPGVAEVALLDRIIDVIDILDTGTDRGRGYDLVVFDTAPTGHTLQLLRMPAAMTTWIQALVKHRRAVLEIDRGGAEQAEAAAASDPVLTTLERRHDRLTGLRARVTDRARTAFALVTVPERLAIEETARAAEQFEDTGVHLGALIVNRLLPDGLEGEFYAARKAQERVHLDEITRHFGRLPRISIHQLPRDVYGLDPLGRISDELVAQLSARGLGAYHRS